MIDHFHIQLPSFPRGYHLITDHILENIKPLPDKGLFHLFIHHTSAALTINENADPDVRIDFEQIINRLVPENLPFLRHTSEGPDDMPAHIKAALIGSSISIPVIDGRFHLGTWQGIYLCEFRTHPTRRRLTATLYT